MQSCVMSFGILNRRRSHLPFRCKVSKQVLALRIARCLSKGACKSLIFRHIRLGLSNFLPLCFQ
jgi:hypothetical protein